MTITAPRPPRSAASAARSTIRELGSEASTLQVIQIYGADLEDLADGGGMAAFKPSGWRWLVPGDEHWTAVDILTDEAGEPIGRPQRQRGSVIDDLARVVLEATNMPNLDDEPYETRLVEVPDLNFASIWVAQNETDQGVVITLSPIASYARHTYLPPDALGKLLSDSARHQFEVDVESTVSTSPTETPSRDLNAARNIMTHARPDSRQAAPALADWLRQVESDVSQTFKRQDELKEEVQRVRGERTSAERQITSLKKDFQKLLERLKKGGQLTAGRSASSRGTVQATTRSSATPARQPATRKRAVAASVARAAKQRKSVKGKTALSKSAATKSVVAKSPTRTAAKSAARKFATQPKAIKSAGGTGQRRTPTARRDASR